MLTIAEHSKAPRYFDILLDFMDRSNRQLYRLYENSSKSNHVRVLLETLNVAALLCNRVCICPPGPIAECAIARFVFSTRSEWFRSGLIKWPLREGSWDEFFDKKEREYGPFRAEYPDLYRSGIRRFFRQYPEAILHRETLIGRGIAGMWESGADVPGIWRERLGCLSGVATERLRTLPTQLLDDGIAVAWPAIEAAIPTELRGRSDLARAVLQHFRFKLYLHEYNLRILTGVPFATVDLKLGSLDLRYDFEAFREALEALHLWSVVRAMSDSSILRLRSTPGFFAFRSAFETITNSTTDVRQIGKIFAFATAGTLSNRVIRETSIISYDEIARNKWNELDLSEGTLQAIDYRLLASSEIINNGRIDFNMAKIETTNAVGGDRPIVAIFTALQFERELLIKRWKLTNKSGESVWSGILGKYRLLLYGPDEAGRVPAAVQTMDFLRKHQPKVILVLGIAGGFEEEKVSRGDVLIPDYIADLATRKIHDQKKQKERPEFRPRPFDVDSLIRAFAKGGSFNRADWEQRVIDEASWPAGLRPTIHYGPVACLDEVVSSTTWRRSLLEAWPKLSGVEMESGGVCAAAKFSGTRVAVVRGVSDLADPRKSDDDWRRRAMVTIAVLIELALATVEIGFNSASIAK